MKYLKFLLLGIIAVSFISCSDSDDDSLEIPEDKDNELARPQDISEYNTDKDGLRDYFATDYFDIGAAIEPNAIDNTNDAKLMKRHFNSLTAENVMKWSSLQKTEGNFTYTSADKIVNFAHNNDMKVRGHALCWHQQAPDWIFEDKGQTASKEVVLERLRTHISNIVAHFKGKVYAWDVVNEAIDDGGNIYRGSKWYNICGEDFIIEAFKAAREADPNLKLFYNDYSTTQPIKRDKIYKLLKKLKDKGLVDGIGMQSHWNINAPSNGLIIDAIQKYASLGIEIQITELDVSVYPSNSDSESEYTNSIETQQQIAYARFFSTFRTYKDNITSVTFWGATDKDSWLNNWPVSGRTNYPLLFDSKHNPKQSYFSVIDF
ncbi:MAG: 1,4-beta-xylanase [Bacteroidales bacterium]|nr:MAG: 1,4-beta-xylanase [Bacteroidales bacterium]